ncbi:hypothetical protein PR048_004686 [Dryococelus australis]|uniref:DDE-1 domain-containing protein n=1 Tax=Dryococelus australis TaxID=614101 RepID=A0ABQ9I635_9NEOP|nr:hypothetical protein PR048_004686 [Dryococelus australis]
MTKRDPFLQNSVAAQPCQEKLKTSKYSKLEEILLEWFQQKPVLKIPIHDPCAAYPKDLDTLKNMHVEFLLANSTSVLQPLDPGIIRTVKHMYRKCPVSRLLQRMTTKTVYSVSLLDAIYMLAASWDSLSQETMQTVLGRQVTGPCQKNCLLGVTSTFNDYVKEDEDLLPCEVQEIENLCKSSENSSMEQLGQPCDANENDNEHDEEDDTPKPVTCLEAMQHLEVYSRYLSNVPDVPESIMKNLWEL